MGDIISFSDFKKKRDKQPEFKVKLSKKNIKNIQESLNKINNLMREIKDEARKQANSLENKGKNDEFK